MATGRTVLACLALLGILALAFEPPTARAQEPAFAFEFGATGSGAGGLEGVTGVAVDADGNVWASDRDGQVVKYDYNGRHIASLPGPAGGGGSFVRPEGIAADDRGFLYVADAGPPGRIVKIDTAGRFVSAVTRAETVGLRAPSAVALDGSGRIYVAEAETGLNRVSVFSAAGRLVGQFAARSPGGVTIDPKGEVLVAENSPGRIGRFGADRRRTGTIGEGAFTGSINELALGPGGTLHVSDFGGSVIRRFASGGEERPPIGARGLGAGQSNGPTGVAVDCRGNVYLADGAAERPAGDLGAGSKILKFAVPGAPPPPCAPRRPLPGAIDTQLDDLEVTQGIQPEVLHTLTAGQLAPSLRSRPYGTFNVATGGGEVPLLAGGKTVVRAYASLASGPPGGMSGVPATLEGFRDGRSLGTIQPDGGPAVLQVGGVVSLTRRTDPAGAYTFTLPARWTRAGRIDLVARVNPAGLGCDAVCRRRSSFRLTGVPFTGTPIAGIEPIALTVNRRLPELDGRTIHQPGELFDVTRLTTPRALSIGGWAGRIEIGDLARATRIKVEKCLFGIELGILCTEETVTPTDARWRDLVTGELMDRIERWIDGRGLGANNTVIPFAIIPATSQPLPGSMRGRWGARGTFPNPRGYAVIDRPFTAIAHEVQHAFGRPHAGQMCPGSGAGTAQAGEPWPPEDRGVVRGVGLDVRSGSGGSRGPFQVVAPGVRGGPSDEVRWPAAGASEIFDLMSYCGTGLPTWISPKGWTDVIRFRARAAAAGVAGEAGAAQARARRLRVTAVESADGSLAVTGVAPTRNSTPAADPDSPYFVEARSSSGAILASRRVDAEELEDSDGKAITGSIPAPDGTSQVIVRRGTEAATRRMASENPPTVRLRSPRRGSVARSRELVVRWSAGDPDGGPLTATVEYSSDGGRRWAVVDVGPAAGGTARISRSLLAASKRARVRVRVDDGFNETTATSGRFTVVGSAPSVRILDPARGMRVRADAPLRLRGEAIGARGRRLGPRSLTWLDGGRRIGRGPDVTVAGLRPGRHRISLVARQGGRSRRATVPIVVRSVPPAFLRLDAPARVGRRARAVRLRVATNVRARLSVRGQRFTVSPRARSVRVRVPRGSRPLRLALTVRSAGRTTRRTVTIARR